MTGISLRMRKAERTRRDVGRSETGQAMVEAALAFPVLLLAAIGLLQFAVFVHAQNTVIAAVQEGARAAAAEGGSAAGGLAVAQGILQAGLTSNGGVSVTISEGTELVTASAHGSLPMLIPWVPGVSLPLGAQATISREHFDAGAP